MTFDAKHNVLFIWDGGDGVWSLRGFNGSSPFASLIVPNCGHS